MAPRFMQPSLNYLAICLTFENPFVVFFVDWEAVVKLSDDFNGADLRNVCTEAGEWLTQV